MRARRVVVSGLGALTPIGNTVHEFWGNLVRGISGEGQLTRFPVKNLKTRFGCELKGFDPGDFLGHKERRIHDSYVHYALVATGEAINHSKIVLENIDRTRCGVVWGTGNGAISSMEKDFFNYFKGADYPGLSPYFIPKIISNIASGVLSIKYGFQGPAFTPVAACATANAAFLQAYNYIRFGEADVMIAGASDAAITASTIGGFNAIKALSTRNEDAGYASRPFDESRDGFVIGEGAGALVLEDYEHALRRGAAIYAELAAASMTSDAHHLTAAHPHGDGASRAILNTVKQAGLIPADIDLVNAHATATRLGDVSEVRALENVFGAKIPAITANKSMIGHLLGASGAVEAVATVMSVYEGIVPPTINLEKIDSQIDFISDSIVTEKKELSINSAISNSFGFGGHNAVVLFRKI